MNKQSSLTEAIIKRTYVVPVSRSKNEKANSEVIAGQLDAALMKNGFKADKGLLEYVRQLSSTDATEVGEEIINAVQKLVGNHVQHNTYFKEFPKNVPDTQDFWLECLRDALLNPETAEKVSSQVYAGFVNLLDLPRYGKYLHTYEEMIAAHEEFVPLLKRKFKVLRLGGTLQEESLKLYFSLAESKVPASGDDLDLLLRLAEVHVNDEQPEKIPVRENRAVINVARLQAGQVPLADTVTDVLRLAVKLSGGDISLQENTKFKSFSHKTRKGLLKALDHVISDNKAKLGDVYKHREQFKRLFHYLKVKNPQNYPNALEVKRIAQEKINLSFEAKVERAFGNRDINEAILVLSKNPGLFVRSFNRLLVSINLGELSKLNSALLEVLPKVSTPVVVGLRQYLENRNKDKDTRVFVNRKGTGKVVENKQTKLDTAILNPVVRALDEEVVNRLPKATYIFNRDVLGVALPLSNKMTNSGFNVLSRGSVDAFEGEILRFFMYWKEKSHTTDLDLSAIMFNDEFKNVGQISYTNLKDIGSIHSGDITSSRNGATEFIDVDTAKVGEKAKYIIPQVNKYSGEGYDEVEESFFGYMARTEAEKGQPYETTTVKTKGELRGKNNIALPLAFVRQDDGTWQVKWINAFLQGYGWGNATENNTFNTATLVKSIIDTDFLTVNYLATLLENRKDTPVLWEDEIDITELEGDAEMVYVGRDVPAEIPENIQTITLTNLHELF